MLDIYKKFARTGIDIALLAITVFLVLTVFAYSYKIATPIFIALLIYIVIEPLAKFLNRKGMKITTATKLSMLVFVLVLVGLFVTVGFVFADQVQNLSIIIPKYINLFKETFIDNIDVYQSKMKAIPPDVLMKIQDLAGTMASKSSSILSNALIGMFSTISSVSTMAFNLVVGIILAYFLSVEIDDWKTVVNTKTPKTIRHGIFFFKENVLKGLGKYIKAQLILISCTFGIIFIGLLCAGVDNSFSIAVLSAFFDILPLLGIPVVFIPWIIYSYVIGKTGFAIFLLILLAVAMIFRQLAEPKIVGDSLGVSAFTMLSFMIISLSLFGVGGLIATPILIILLKALYEQGYLRRWIHIPSDEFDSDTKK